MKSYRNDKRGAALMLALWALFLLSAMIISWALDINTRLALNGNANRVLEAEAMACSGAEIALHPAIKPGSSLLVQHRTKTQSFETRITGEGGRLNLNWILSAAVSNPLAPQMTMLDKYLELRGIELNDRNRMIDCLLDWVDPDNLVRLNGAEQEGDYHPANALLSRIDDVKRVKGWEQFTSARDWDADFTLANGTGAVDLHWASREVLLALPGATEPVVDQFLQMRRGPDGIDGTEDDGELTRDTALVALGYTTPQLRQVVDALVAFNTPVQRVVSVGKSGDVTRVVRMVIKPGRPPQLISWKEL